MAATTPASVPQIATMPGHGLAEAGQNISQSSKEIVDGEDSVGHGAAWLVVLATCASSSSFLSRGCRSSLTGGWYSFALMGARSFVIPILVRLVERSISPVMFRLSASIKTTIHGNSSAITRHPKSGSSHTLLH